MAAAAPDGLEERLLALDERVQGLRSALQADDERKIKVNTDLNTLKVWMNRIKPTLDTLDLSRLEERVRLSTGELVQTHADRLLSLEALDLQGLESRLDLQGLEDRMQRSMQEFVQTHVDQLRSETAEYTQAQVERLREDTGAGMEAHLAAQSGQLAESFRLEHEALRGEFAGAKEEWQANFEALDAQLDVWCNSKAQAPSQERLDALDFEVHQLRSLLADEVSAREQINATLLEKIAGAAAAATDDLGAQRLDGVDSLQAAAALDVRLGQVEATLLDVVVHGSQAAEPGVAAGESLETLKGIVADLKAELEVLRLRLDEGQLPGAGVAAGDPLETLNSSVAELKAELEVLRLEQGQPPLSPQFSVRTEVPQLEFTLEDAAGRAWSFDTMGDFLAYVARRLKECQETIDGEAGARAEMEQRLLLDRSQRQASRELLEEQRRQVHQQSQQVVVRRVEEMNASIAASMTSKSDKEDFIYINGEVLEIKSNLRQLEQRLEATSQGGPPTSALQSEDGGAVGESGGMKLIEDLQAQSVRLQTLARECHFSSSQGQPEIKPALMQSPSLMELYIPAAPNMTVSLASPQPVSRPMREPSPTGRARDPVAVREARAGPLPVPVPLAARVPSQKELWQPATGGSVRVTTSPRAGVALSSVIPSSCRSPSRDQSPVARRQPAMLSPPQLVRGVLGGTGSFPSARLYQPEGPGGERITR